MPKVSFSTLNKAAAVGTALGMITIGCAAIAQPAGAGPSYQNAPVELVRSGKGWKQNWNRGGGSSRSYGRYYYSPRYYYPRYNYGYDVWGPMFGFGAGVLFGTILTQPRYYYVPRQPYGNRDAYCRAKYRSYNARTGTYTGYDGRQHYCRIP